MTLQALAAFVAVADTRSFRRTGEHLFMHSSSVSRLVKQLERSLGGPLFVRDTRKVALTAFGELCLPTARDVLEGVYALHEHARRDGTDGVSRPARAGRRTRKPDTGAAGPTG